MQKKLLFTCGKNILELVAIPFGKYFKKLVVRLWVWYKQNGFFNYAINVRFSGSPVCTKKIIIVGQIDHP